MADSDSTLLPYSAEEIAAKAEAIYGGGGMLVAQSAYALGFTDALREMQQSFVAPQSELPEKWERHAATFYEQAKSERGEDAAYPCGRADSLTECAAELRQASQPYSEPMK